MAAKADDPIVVPDPDQPVSFDVISEGYGHSMKPVIKDSSIDPCHSGAGTLSCATPTARVQTGPQFLDVDSIGLPEFSAVDEPARRSTRVPPRIVERPRVEEWTDDELMTLPEAAALFWPAGPITTNTLRTAGTRWQPRDHQGRGQVLHHPMAIRRIGLDEAAAVRLGVAEAVVASPEAVFQMKLAEAKALGRERARPPTRCEEICRARR